MPVFCERFGWCSPEAFRALSHADFTRLARHLVEQAERSKAG